MVVLVSWVWSKRKTDLRSVCVFCYLWRFDGLELQWMSEPTQWMSIYVIMNVLFLCVVCCVCTVYVTELFGRKATYCTSSFVKRRKTLIVAPVSFCS